MIWHKTFFITTTIIITVIISCYYYTLQVGELCVSGVNVAAGYVDDGGGSDVSATDCSFISNPFVGSAEDQYDVLYRTGDFGRVFAGRLIYEGRKDMQVSAGLSLARSLW